MAKKELSVFEKFSNAVEKGLNKEVEIRGFADIDDYIGSGNYLLNAQLSGSLFGGFPNARMMGIAGDPGCLIKTEKIRIYKLESKKFSRNVIRENSVVKVI